MLGNPCNPLVEMGGTSHDITPAQWEALMRTAERSPLQFIPDRQMTCRHCWHPYVGAWAGAQPPPMHCCWCGQQTDLQEAMLNRHGPYVGGR